MKYVPLSLAQEKWLKNPDLVRIMTVLNQGKDRAKIVGGAVRDALMNIYWDKKRTIGDIDIASKLCPEDNIALLERDGIKVVPTGIKHGTITAVLNGKPYEITTLRRDVKTDGRHAEVEFTDDWAEDAKRRDFTINAFYLDMNGTIIDPINGFDDLKAGRVRFIGDAEKRIKEDALRILRFFRFSSQIDANEIDKQGLNASITLKHMIEGLSGERIWQEFNKILISQRADKVIPIMANQGILSEIIPGYHSFDGFLKYIKNEKEMGLQNVIGRLSLLIPWNEQYCKDIAQHLRLSNAQAKQLSDYNKEYKKHDLDPKVLRKKLYKKGKDVVIHNLVKMGVMDQKTLSYINGYIIPEFPIQGRDLMDEGWKAGRELGAELKRLEQLWIRDDFDSSNLTH